MLFRSGPGDLKCKKCLADHKGCRWDGMSRMPVVEKKKPRLVAKPKAIEAVAPPIGETSQLRGRHSVCAKKALAVYVDSERECIVPSMR